MFEFEDFRSQRLAQGENGAAAEALKFDVLRHLFAFLKVRLNLSRFGQTDLSVGVFDGIVGHNLALARDFDVSLVGIDHYDEVFVRAKEFGDDTAETLFEHPEQCGTVDVLRFVEIGKRLKQ